MKKFILPLAAGLALSLSGGAMAGNLNSDHGKAAAQEHSAAVASVSGPQLLTDAQMDRVVAGGAELGQATLLPGNRPSVQFCLPHQSVNANPALTNASGYSSYNASYISDNSSGCL